MNWTLYGLLYLDKTEGNSMNVQLKTFKERINLYFKNAVTLSNSLQKKGIKFVLLTNDLNLIKENCIYSQAEIDIEQISFVTQVPVGIRFYSAHFKLDVYRYLATLMVPYIGFCDLDMICINDIPHCLSENISQQIPMIYDISDQVVPAYGQDTITRDIESILRSKSQGKWYGGEFIAGSPNFFAILIQEIDQLYNNYITNISQFHHVGDEAITTAALESLQKKGMQIVDAGKLKIVGRFWSIKVLHHQKSFDWYQDCFLLHLPADKKFLASIASKKTADVGTFTQEFRAYKSWPSWLRRW
jgi:hypothetical protein